MESKKITLQALTDLTAAANDFAEKLIDFAEGEKEIFLGAADAAKNYGMLGEMDTSEPAAEIVEIITTDLFGCIEDALHDICVNAIDERERYAEDSTQMRALWLDNVIEKSEEALSTTRKAIDNLRAKMR